MTYRKQTANKLLKWPDATTEIHPEDSAVTDNGTTVSSTEPVSITSTTQPQFITAYDGTYRLSTSVESDGKVIHDISGPGIVVFRRDSTDRVTLVLRSYGATAQPNAIVSQRARGSLASPAAVNAGDILFSFGGEGFASGDFAGTNHAVIQFLAAEAFSSTNQGAFIRFQTTPKGSTVASRATRGVIDDAGRWGIGHTTPTNISTQLDVTQTDAGTNDVQVIASIDRQTSGTAAAGFGARLAAYLESSTTARQIAGAIDWLWTTATHATRTADIVFNAVLSGTLGEVWRMTAAGRLDGKKAGITEEGGYYCVLTAGESLSRGEVVQITQGAGGADGKVYKNAIDSDMPVGVVYADASADAAVKIVTSGIAYVLPEAGYTATRGYVIYSSDATAGRVDQGASVPEALQHFREIGHWLDTGSGNGAITRAIVHFN